MKYIIWAGFIIVFAAQWHIPANMILAKERVLRKGTLVKFQTAPIDPNDPFRGKYIFLSFKENTFKLQKSTSMRRGQKIFVLLKKDKDEFGTIENISETRPVNSKLFIEAMVNYVNEDGTINIRYPFERFYMEESKAPEAERIYNERRADSSQKAYALVSILEGDAVIKDVLINDSSITELVKRAR